VVTRTDISKLFHKLRCEFQRVESLLTVYLIYILVIHTGPHITRNWRKWLQHKCRNLRKLAQLLLLNNVHFNGVGDKGAGVQAHSQKFWFVENPRKIWPQSPKIGAKSLKIWAKSLKVRVKMAPNVSLQKMAPNLCRKTHEDLFWRSHQKKVVMIFVGENLSKKLPASIHMCVLIIKQWVQESSGLPKLPNKAHYPHGPEQFSFLEVLRDWNGLSNYSNFLSKLLLLHQKLCC